MRSFRITEILIIIMGSFLLTLLMACAPDQIAVINSENEAEEQTELEVLLENPDRIGFSEVSRLAFGSACNSCHNPNVSAGGVNLQDYQSLVNSRVPNLIMLGEPMESRLFTSLEAKSGARKMPPGPEAGLSDDQKMLVYQWITRGAPEKPGERQAFLSLNEKLNPYFDHPETIDYEVVKKWVFEPGRCYSCHSRQGYRADPTAILFGADMTRYSNLFLSNAIVSGQPRNQYNRAGALQRMGSQIYEAVAHERSMPPADQGFFPLSDLRVKLLRLWILNCAIEDYNPNDDIGRIKDSGPAEKVRNCY